MTALAATPDGLWIASESSDGSIIVWNMVDHDLSPIMDWGAHPEEIVALQFSPIDGQCLASSSFSHIRIWDTVHGTQLATLLAGPNNDSDLNTFRLSCVNSMVWSPAGAIIAYGANGVLQWWDTNTFLNSDRPSLLGGTQSSNGTAPYTIVVPDGSCRLTRPRLIETTKQPGAGHNIGDFTINSQSLLYSVLSFNGGRLTTTHQDGSILIWDLSELVNIPSSYKLLQAVDR